MQHRGPVMSTDVAKNQKRTLIRLLSYLKDSKYLLFISFIFVIVSVFSSLSIPKLTGLMINRIEDKNYYLTDLCIILIILVFISLIFSYLLTVLLITISQNTIKKMRRDLFNKILDLPINFYEKNKIGDIVSRITYDIDLVNQSLSNDVVQFLKSILILIFSLIMMISESIILTAIILLLTPINIYIAKYRLKKVKPLFKNRSISYGLLNGFSEEMLSNLKTIKAYGLESDLINNFDQFNTKSINAAYNADKEVCKLGPSVNLINNLSLSIIALIGSILYLKNIIRLGNISSFIQYSKKFSGPINEFSNIVSEIQSSLAALERVISIIDSKSEYEDKLELIEYKAKLGKIDLVNVSFKYDKPLFENLNLNILPNKKIAIVGPTGSGKTTIINMLMRFYDIYDGKIYLDDLNAYEIKLKDLRKSFSYVSQEGWIFKGTILENIKYSNEEASINDVIEASKMAQLQGFIENLPNKFDTVIDKSSISNGQAQLISLARAILSKSKILILDEATSNVDTLTEKLIEKAFLESTKDKTSFIIAHRLQTIINCDLILVVNDGKIIEQGTHEELLKLKGSYYELYNSQYL